jgi:hypothetical protein
MSILARRSAVGLSAGGAGLFYEFYFAVPRVFAGSFVLI